MAETIKVMPAVTIAPAIPLKTHPTASQVWPSRGLCPDGIVEGLSTFALIVGEVSAATIRSGYSVGVAGPKVVFFGVLAQATIATHTTDAITRLVPFTSISAHR
jgi:hypothetical protein